MPIFATQGPFMKKKLISDAPLIQVMLSRLAMQLIENHKDFSDTVIIGLQPRGKQASIRLTEIIKGFTGISVPLGFLDTTFHRDDFRRRASPLQPNATFMPFLVEEKNVILVDDVLFTGRSLRAGLDAMTAYGRPKGVELLVLIDRRYTRELPVQATYTGVEVDSVQSQHVMVEWKETGFETDAIWLLGN
jgi:pyrimidine operon attenuation protein / uracil phosphoribosyltransferase